MSLFFQAAAILVKRFSRLPARELPFCSHRNVAQRCGPMACRSCGEAARLRKHWPGSVEGTSCAGDRRRAIHCASRKRLLRPALADRNGRVSQKNQQPPRSGGITQRVALRAVDLYADSGRRGGEGSARRVAEWIRPVRCRCRDAPSANPVASLRSRAASSHDRPATGASLGHVSVRAERWLGGRQLGETFYKYGDSQRKRLSSPAGSRA